MKAFRSLVIRISGRLAAAVLCAALLLTLSACGRTAQGEGPSSGGGEQGEPSQTAPELSSQTPPEGSSEALPEQPKSRAEALLEELTVEEKVWQLFMVRPEQLTEGDGAVTDAAAVTALAEKPVGGVILFAQNLEDREQAMALLSGLQDASSLGLLLAVDEEGGAVSRVGRNPAMGATKIGSMASVGATGDTEEARQVGLTIGSELKALGFHLDFAPVADVNSNPNNTVIGNRSFGSDPVLVAQFVAAAVEGFHQGELACTLKHFPGHGDTAEDSHTSSAFTGKTLEELRSCELLPFEAGIAAGADCVMVAHISALNALGSDVPASLSWTAVTGLLRGELGFRGVAVTDSLRMAAVTGHYSQGEAAVLALLAGEDILLDPLDLDEAYAGVLQAVRSGRISEERLDESVERILTLKLRYGAVN